MFNLQEIKLPNKIYEPRVQNFGDWLNGLPVVSGLYKSVGEPLKYVCNPALRRIKGFREFMEHQECISELLFRDEMIVMDEASYLTISYANDEFKDLGYRPNRPIETIRWEKFVKDYYPKIPWEVDDDFELKVIEPECSGCMDAFLNDRGISHDMFVVGDRWSQVTDKRRNWEILANSLKFIDGSKFYFLRFEDDLMTNAQIIKWSYKPFISTFTGAGMLADLLNKESLCLYDDSMCPTWNGAPIEYSYFKHYYFNRGSTLLHIDDPKLNIYLKSH